MHPFKYLQGTPFNYSRRHSFRACCCAALCYLLFITPKARSTGTCHRRLLLRQRHHPRSISKRKEGKLSHSILPSASLYLWLFIPGCGLSWVKTLSYGTSWLSIFYLFFYLFFIYLFRIFNFVCSSYWRLGLCAYWVVVLLVSITTMGLLQSRRVMIHNIPNIIVRKYFHFLTLIMFIPAVLHQVIPSFTPALSPPPHFYSKRITLFVLIHLLHHFRWSFSNSAFRSP